MESLDELHRRKAELKAKIEQQRRDLKGTFLEVREEIEPANLLKKAVSGIFNVKSTDDKSGIFKRLPPPLAFVADILIKDPKMGFLVKMLAPVALNFFKKSTSEKPDEISGVTVKAKVFGSLRRGISSLRNRLRKGTKNVEKTAGTEGDTTTESTEN